METKLKNTPQHCSPNIQDSLSCAAVVNLVQLDRLYAQISCQWLVRHTGVANIISCS